MNSIVKNILLVIVVLFALTSQSVFAQASISIDHVDGLSLGKAKPDTPIKFHIRWENNTGTNIRGGSPSLRVFLSNNGELPMGEFEPVVADTLPLGFPELFDLIFRIAYRSADGIGSDTVIMGGTIISGPGIYDGFNSVIGHIATSVTADYAGDSLCIDSTFVPQNPWRWDSPNGIVTPDWSGPHCYEILPSCCNGIKGNVDSSPDEIIDISDLDLFAGLMFRDDDTPYCKDEVDWDGDGVIDISDLVAYVDFFFLDGPQPPACPTN